LTRSSACGMPTSLSRSIARFVASSFETLLWTRTASASWSPIV
jgi:hypothetical protein